MAEDKGRKSDTGSQKTDEKKGGTSMVAPHPFSKRKKSDDLKPVEDLAKETGLKAWETAGLMKAARWAGGKQVTREEFEAGLSAFRERRQGGGRI